MNTKFESFAFFGTIVATFVLPVLFLMATIGVAVVFGGGESGERAAGIVILFTALFYAVLYPLFCIGSAVIIERTHFRKIAEAERELSTMLVSDLKTLPPNWKPVKTFFVCENVVVANDYLKRFFWIFRKLIGGRSESFGKLVERGRREVMIRLLKQARLHGANVVWNVRMETTIVQLNSGGDNKSMAGVEFMAYGTAFFIDR